METANDAANNNRRKRRKQRVLRTRRLPGAAPPAHFLVSFPRSIESSIWLHPHASVLSVLSCSTEWRRLTMQKLNRRKRRKQRVLRTRRLPGAAPPAHFLVSLPRSIESSIWLHPHASVLSVLSYSTELNRLTMLDVNSRKLRKQ